MTDQPIPEKEPDRPTDDIHREIVDEVGTSDSQGFLQEPDATRRNARLWDVLRELERLIAEGGDIPEHQVERLEGLARRARGQ